MRERERVSPGWNGNSCCARPTWRSCLPKRKKRKEGVWVYSLFFLTPPPSFPQGFLTHSRMFPLLLSIYMKDGLLHTIKFREKTFLSVSKNIFHVWGMGKLRFRGVEYFWVSLCSAGVVEKNPNWNRWDLVVCSKNSKWALKKVLTSL